MLKWGQTWSQGAPESVSLVLYPKEMSRLCFYVLCFTSVLTLIQSGCQPHAPRDGSRRGPPGGPSQQAVLRPLLLWQPAPALPPPSLPRPGLCPFLSLPHASNQQTFGVSQYSLLFSSYLPSRT